ncbi:MAG: hypothetical protein AB8V57_02425 [Coxiella endosymbiont of Dermacentor nuttalli]
MAKDIPTYTLAIIYDNGAKDLSETIKQLKKIIPISNKKVNIYQ